MSTNQPIKLAVIDLTGVDTDPARLHEEGRRLDAINGELGFFCVSGTGISQDLIDRMYAITAEFFHLPDEVKQKSYRRDDIGMRGWEPAGERGLAWSIGEKTPPDMREVFGSSREVDPNDPYYREVEGSNYFFAGTNWPEQPEGFRQTWLEYYAEMERISGLIYRVMESALGLKQGWFTQFNDRHASPMISNYYPPTKSALPGQLRAGAHTDYGAFTILYQDDAPGGLQVLDQESNEWIDVLPTPGAFNINIGDLLARWTNDRWVSTLHRVTLPPFDEAAGLSERISVPFFQQPNADAVIECIPGCEGRGGAKYEPITSGANWYNKNSATIEGYVQP
ncbi:MAG: isopenicillin N synthase family oxygenase [Actinobacteria bacterium]|nr:isopenicillin N synthase family oxygenase [Actinomycetota bacterium]